MTPPMILKVVIVCLCLMELCSFSTRGAFALSSSSSASKSAKKKSRFPSFQGHDDLDSFHCNINGDGKDNQQCSHYFHHVSDDGERFTHMEYHVEHAQGVDIFNLDHDERISSIDCSSSDHSEDDDDKTTKEVLNIHCVDEEAATSLLFNLLPSHLPNGSTKVVTGSFMWNCATQHNNEVMRTIQRKVVQVSMQGGSSTVVVRTAVMGLTDLFRNAKISFETNHFLSGDFHVEQEEGHTSNTSASAHRGGNKETIRVQLDNQDNSDKTLNQQQRQKKQYGDILAKIELLKKQYAASKKNPWDVYDYGFDDGDDEDEDEDEGPRPPAHPIHPSRPDIPDAYIPWSDGYLHSQLFDPAEIIATGLDDVAEAAELYERIQAEGGQRKNPFVDLWNYAKNYCQNMVLNFLGNLERMRIIALQLADRTVYSQFDNGVVKLDWHMKRETNREKDDYVGQYFDLGARLYDWLVHLDGNVRFSLIIENFVLERLELVFIGECKMKISFSTFESFEIGHGWKYETVFAMQSAPPIYFTVGSVPFQLDLSLVVSGGVRGSGGIMNSATFGGQLEGGMELGGVYARDHSNNDTSADGEDADADEKEKETERFPDPDADYYHWGDDDEDEEATRNALNRFQFVHSRKFIPKAQIFFDKPAHRSIFYSVTPFLETGLQFRLNGVGGMFLSTRASMSNHLQYIDRPAEEKQVRKQPPASTASASTSASAADVVQREIVLDHSSDRQQAASDAQAGAGVTVKKDPTFPPFPPHPENPDWFSDDKCLYSTSSWSVSVGVGAYIALLGLPKITQLTIPPLPIYHTLIPLMNGCIEPLRSELSFPTEKPNDVVKYAQAQAQAQAQDQAQETEVRTGLMVDPDLSHFPHTPSRVHIAAVPVNARSWSGTAHEGEEAFTGQDNFLYNIKHSNNNNNNHASQNQTQNGEKNGHSDEGSSPLASEAGVETTPQFTFITGTAWVGKVKIKRTQECQEKYGSAKYHASMSLQLIQTSSDAQGSGCRVGNSGDNGNGNGNQPQQLRFASSITNAYLEGRRCYLQQQMSATFSPADAHPLLTLLPVDAQYDEDSVIYSFCDGRHAEKEDHRRQIQSTKIHLAIKESARASSVRLQNYDFDLVGQAEDGCFQVKLSPQNQLYTSA